jgi:hypothetical protein
MYRSDVPKQVTGQRGNGNTTCTVAGCSYTHLNLVEIETIQEPRHCNPHIRLSHIIATTTPPPWPKPPMPLPHIIQPDVLPIAVIQQAALTSTQKSLRPKPLRVLILPRIHRNCHRIPREQRSLRPAIPLPLIILHRHHGDPNLRKWPPTKPLLDHGSYIPQLSPILERGQPHFLTLPTAHTIQHLPTASQPPFVARGRRNHL